MNFAETPDIQVANYFLEKFSAIPAELWTTGLFNRPTQLDGKDVVLHCAMGHLGHSQMEAKKSAEAAAFAALFKDYAGKSIYSVNDGFANNVSGTHPKERVIDMMPIIIEAITKEAKEKGMVPAVYKRKPK